MGLEPILQLLEEPVDPAVVLLGDALPNIWKDSADDGISVTSSDLRDELGLHILDGMLVDEPNAGGTGVADMIDITAVKAAEEEEELRRAAERAAQANAAAEQAKIEA